MEKITIGLDIDGTITDFSGFLLMTSPRYMKKHYGLNIKDPSGYDIDEMYNLKEYTENHENKIGLSAHKIVKQFWTKHFISYCLGNNCRKGMAEFTEKCSEIANIAIFTSRDRSTAKGITGVFVRCCTRLQLKKYKIKYDEIIFFSDDEAKINGIINYRPDYMIDDKAVILKNLEDNIKTVCISAPYNFDINQSDVDLKTDSFNEIYEFLIGGQDHEQRKRTHRLPVNR